MGQVTGCERRPLAVKQEAVHVVLEQRPPAVAQRHHGEPRQRVRASRPQAKSQEQRDASDIHHETRPVVDGIAGHSRDRLGRRRNPTLPGALAGPLPPGLRRGVSRWCRSVIVRMHFSVNRAPTAAPGAELRQDHLLHPARLPVGQQVHLAVDVRRGRPHRSRAPADRHSPAAPPRAVVGDLPRKLRIRRIDVVDADGLAAGGHGRAGSPGGTPGSFVPLRLLLALGCLVAALSER